MREQATAAFRRIVEGCQEIQKIVESDTPDKWDSVFDPASLMSDVRTLDEYITGSTSCRSLIDDMTAAKRFAHELEPWLVYLSDGGYTRLCIDHSFHYTMHLTGGPNASWETKLERFKDIGGKVVV